MIQGVDISHYNGPIDFGKVASAGVAFAYVKASEGRFTKDPLYPTNYAGLKQNQVPRGAYHFFYPQLDAQSQASNFLSVVTHLVPGDLPPALDVEVSGEQTAAAIAAGIQQWLDLIQQNLGRTPVIYSSASFWNTALGGTSAFASYPLWVAQYTSNASPNIPAGFSDYLFWQYSESGTMPGVTGNLDMDWFKGSPADLNQMAGLGNSPG